MKVTKILPDINNYVDKSTHCYYPDETSHQGLVVPEIILQYGKLRKQIREIPSVVPLLVKTINQAKKSYSQLREQPKNSKKTISKKQLDGFSKYAKSLGILHVGFAKVEPSMIFKGKKILYQNAIILLMEMKKEKIELAPSFETGHEIFVTYYKLGLAANKLTEYLKGLQYEAQAGPALGGDVNYPLLAQKAGLGLIGKHGLLITSAYGPSLRIAAIYTEIENLPNSNLNEHNWIADFCEQCLRCVKKCPVNAIYGKTKVFTDGSKEHIDYKKCAIPFSNDNRCTICIKECLFFTENYHNIKDNYLK